MSYTNILGNLSFSDGRSNPSGIKTTCYFIPKSAIVTYPAVAAAPASLSDYAVLDGDFALVDGAYFNSLYTTQGTSSVEFETLGDKDNRAFTNTATLSYPDLSDDAAALASNLANSNMVFIVPHFTVGGKVRYAVIGGEHYDAAVTTTGTSGAAAGDTKGVVFSVSSSDCVALPSYIGELPLAGGTLDCGTGVFTPTAEDE